MPGSGNIGKGLGSLNLGNPIFMAVLTGIYLVVEMSFNARLLDVAGSLASAEEIHHIEVWGRLLSGFALGLALFGSVLIPADLQILYSRVSRPVWLLFVAWIFAMSMAGMWLLQERLITSLVDGSTPQERQDVALTLQAANGLHRGDFSLEGVNLSAGRDEPGEKAFMALFPLLASNDTGVRAAVRGSLPSLTRQNASWMTGNPDEVYRSVYLPVNRTLHELYDGYAAVDDAYDRVMASRWREGEKAWKTYLRDLGTSPRNVNYLQARFVRRKLNQRGIPVSRFWDPRDKAGFVRAVATKISREAKRWFSETAGKLIPDGGNISPGLSFSGFARQNAVRALVAQKLPQSLAQRMRPDLGKNAFIRSVWTPARDDLAREELVALSGPAREMSDDGRFADYGRNAVKAKYVPVLALAFSLLGAFVHVLKFSNYVGRIFIPRAAVRWAMLVVIATGILSAPVLAEPALMRSHGYQAYATSAETRYGSPLISAASWVIRAQPYAYPANEAARERLLFSYDFGVHNRGPGPEAPVDAIPLPMPRPRPD